MTSEPRGLQFLCLNLPAARKCREHPKPPFINFVNPTKYFHFCKQTRTIQERIKITHQSCAASVSWRYSVRFDGATVILSKLLNKLLISVRANVFKNCDPMNRPVYETVHHAFDSKKKKISINIPGMLFRLLNLNRLRIKTRRGVVSPQRTNGRWCCTCSTQWTKTLDSDEPPLSCLQQVRLNRSTKNPGFLSPRKLSTNNHLRPAGTSRCRWEIWLRDVNCHGQAD